MQDNVVTKLIDNRFTEEQCANIEKAFRRYDANGSGLISRKEMAKACKHTHKDLNKSEIDFVFAAIDLDGDHHINLKEFANFVYICQNPQEDDTMECQRVFAGFDTDKSGFIDKEELGKALKAMGIEIKKNTLDRFYDYIDSDKSGEISLVEFMTFYRMVKEEG